MVSRDAEIAVLQSELRRVNERLKLLEANYETNNALMNKYGGAVAAAIILIGAAWAIFATFGSNVLKAIGK